MSIDTLKIPYEKVNPNGGAIAFGHPLGATGARQVATAYSECKRSGAKSTSFRRAAAVRAAVLMLRLSLRVQYVHRIRHGHGCHFHERAVGGARRSEEFVYIGGDVEKLETAALTVLALNLSGDRKSVV